jgi:hypothetical protein
MFVRYRAAPPDEPLIKKEALTSSLVWLDFEHPMRTAKTRKILFIQTISAYLKKSPNFSDHDSRFGWY